LASAAIEEEQVPETDLRPSQPGHANPARKRCYDWDDPAAAAAVAADLDGTAFLQAIFDGSLPGVPLARTLDFVPVSVRPGAVVFEFTPAEFHYNPIGSVHGGVLAALCDSACGCAVHSTLPAGTSYTSLDLSIKFLRPVTSAVGRMRCEGTVTHAGSRSALAEARLTDSAGKLFAFATSTCMIFRPTPRPIGP
jgi:uncharacterized protein (TIGR00369 family)